MDDDTKTLCHQTRIHLGTMQKRINLMRQAPISGGEDGCDVGEVKANITMAMRCVENARMRLGKAIQHLEGGVSCLEPVDQEGAKG